MFFQPHQNTNDASSNNAKIFDAISEWSLEEVLTVLPVFHGYVEPQTTQKFLVNELSGILNLDQLDNFKTHLKTALEVLFKKNDNIWYGYKIRLNDQMLIDAAIKANFPTFLIPPANVSMTSPAINFSVDDDKKSITWEGGQMYARTLCAMEGRRPRRVVRDSPRFY